MHQKTLSPPIGCPHLLSRTLRLRQLRHDQVVRAVDQVFDLVGRDGAVQLKRVPAMLADVGHLGGSTRIAIQEQVGPLAVTTLQTDCGLISQKSEDLIPNLGDHITFPGLVLPGTRLGKAIVEPGSRAHSVLTQLRISWAPALPDFSGWN